MEIADVRNIRDVRLALDPGLNVFMGRNAQGKTTPAGGGGAARPRAFVPHR